MSDTSHRAFSFISFLVGLMIPLAGLALWSRSGHRKEEIDKAHDVTVEGSFPASDPPSAW